MSKKILIIKSSSMGDIVHALPVACDIRKAFPDCELSWVVEESFADIPAMSPDIDRFVVTAFRRWRKHILSSLVRREIAEVRNQIKATDYDIVVDLQGLIRTAFVARWAGGNKSVGYSKENIREPLASYFYSRTIDVSSKLPPVLRYRMMAARALGYEIDPQTPKFGLAVEPVMPAGITTGHYAALAINTSRAEKLWPQSRWIEVAKELRRDGMSSVLFWGNDEERTRCEQIAQSVPDALVMPRSSLRTLAEVIAGAKCLIGVDTGLTHLGAALGVPSVGVIVGTSAELFSLVSEAVCATVGNKGVVPRTEEVLAAAQSVMAPEGA